ncbi:MAG: hypothetical protein A2014_11975 [Spirochaetes bacterium GWF1_49_6]|nr:MAG: hypothetical protein A2014_11975 [Spirochaetes bacterium GWF1_49_6]
MSAFQRKMLDSMALPDDAQLSGFRLLSGQNELAAECETWQDTIYHIAGQEYAISKEAENCMIVSPGGGKYGLVFARGHEMYILLNGKVYGGYGMINGPFFSPDDSASSFIYMDNGEFYIRIDDQVSGGYSEIFEPVFSPDGSRAGFIYEKGNQKFVDIDSKSYGAYYFASSPKFSRNSASFGFSFIRDGRHGICFNGEENFGYDAVGDFCLNSSGKIFIFIYQENGEFFININSGVILGPFHETRVLNRNDGGLSLVYRTGDSICLEKISDK